MSYRLQFTLTVACIAAFVAALQPVLVSAGHPEAVWLWCDMLKLCGQ